MTQHIRYGLVPLCCSMVVVLLAGMYLTPPDALSMILFVIIVGPIVILCQSGGYGLGWLWNRWRGTEPPLTMGLVIAALLSLGGFILGWELFWIAQAQLTKVLIDIDIDSRFFLTTIVADVAKMVLAGGFATGGSFFLGFCLARDAQSARAHQSTHYQDMD